jgi:DNA repair protein RecO (recombination protein O)
MASRAGRSAPLTAYVLHRYDWSESSLILDVFTREQGRIAVAAKGAKRPFSQLRSVLLPFQRIHVSLGRQPDGHETREVDTLRAAEWAGGHAMLTGAALFSGFYLNELLMKLLARHDPHPVLFDAYAATVAALGPGDDAEAQSALRAFEIVLLKEIGLLPDLGSETASRRAVRPDARYLVLADSGVVETRDDGEATASGATLAAIQAALASGDLARLQQAARQSLGELRPLLRAQLHYHLGTSQLRTRQVMIDAQALDRTMSPTPADTARTAAR